MGKRMCTSNYKIKAIQKSIRQTFNLVGMKLRDKCVSVWLGISIDEIERVKNSPDKWIDNRYPLIELGMNRNDCIEYCNRYDWEATKSRCYICPYQSDIDWLMLKENDPYEFKLACQEDRRIRNRFSDGQCYLHQSCKPLEEVVFKNKDNNNFINECQGMCNT